VSNPDIVVGPLILAVDQGTSSTKAILVDGSGAVLHSASIGLEQQHPHPGWVEQDALAILDSVKRAITAVAVYAPDAVAAVGLSSQRESAVIWDTETGLPLGPVLGWQDRRTTDRADALAAASHGPLIRRVTGLPLDPMFSALKFAWLLDQVDPDRSLSRLGRIAVGTIDSWLVFALTGEHRIEAGNASRTQLLDVRSGGWDSRLLAIFGIPAATLPRVCASNEPTGAITGVDGLADGTRIHAVLGDSHAALFAHGVRQPGIVKTTYGTGSSVMGLLGPGSAVDSNDGLVTTIAWQLDEPVLAFEGNILSTGATILWLAQILDTDVNQIDRLAQSVTSSAGVTLVPAFSGLGAPWWDDRAQATLTGFQLGTSQAEVARAAFESIPLQIEDVLWFADQSCGARIATVLADGGPSRNDWLMQLQADLSQRTVERSDVAELSATGVAHLAGLGIGLWSPDDVAALPRHRTVFTPRMSPTDAAALRTHWLAAVASARGLQPERTPVRQPLLNA